MFDLRLYRFKPQGAGVTLYFSPEFIRKNQKYIQTNASWYISVVPKGYSLALLIAQLEL